MDVFMNLLLEEVEKKLEGTQYGKAQADDGDDEPEGEVQEKT